MAPYLKYFLNLNIDMVDFRMKKKKDSLYLLCLMLLLVLSKNMEEG